jgi:YidC/Oxa1 family membrane protein insertase
MEKRVLIAVFLSFLVLYFYQALVIRPQQVPPEPPEVVREAPIDTPAVEPEPPRLAVPPVDAVVSDTEERDVVVETATVRVVLANRGAHVRNWELKHYTDEEGQRMDLVPGRIPPDAPRPFMLATDDAEMTARLNQGLFRQVVSARQRIDARNEPVTVAFEYQDAAGLRARKEFSFEPDSYVVTFTADVMSGDRRVNPTVVWGPGLSDEQKNGGFYSQAAEGILFRDSAERLSAKKLRAQAVHEGVFRYAGVNDHYFMSAVVLPDQPLRVEYQPLSVAPAELGGNPVDLVAYSVRAAEPTSLRFFVGPKDFDVLAEVDRDLVRVINFGFFSWLVVPLLRGLKAVNEYTGNYGLSIIILTILINLAIFPLRHKSVVSMRKMQALQPEVKAIQERYGKLKATDPARQKMNVELMNLYRERGVNPASGCVPMLLTIPVLFAFYSLLSQAIELRGAPFALWIQDLSRHDPLYITPVLMGVSMVLQQRMTPSTADPMQQKIMMFMPVMFTFFFLWAPSGLVLYWLSSNVLAIAQQVITNRITAPPQVKAAKAVRPPAERRVKRVGAGKSTQADKNAL